jgi:hypothetical protein
MATLQSLQFLELLLTGHHLSTGELDDLKNNGVEEDLYIEYKHGDDLKKPDRIINAEIRENVSAFANSVGGVLIFGVNAPDRIPTQITGCKGHKKGKLDNWAARCLTPIANYLVPLPRFQVVHHTMGEVLVITVPRSLRYVPISESGGIVYYLRFHDQTLKAPDYLMADLLLGRRQQPIFEISECVAINFDDIPDENYSLRDLKFEIRFRVENVSLVWIDDCEWGVVYWTHFPHDNIIGEKNGKPSQHLFTYLAVYDESFQDTRLRQLVHRRGSLLIVKPFDDDDIVASFRAPLQHGNEWIPYTWKAALYFVARNSLPVWYQIELAINANTFQLFEKQKQLPPTPDVFSIRRLSVERPIVAWEMSQS